MDLINRQDLIMYIYCNFMVSKHIYANYISHYNYCTTNNYQHFVVVEGNHF